MRIFAFLFFLFISVHHLEGSAKESPLIILDAGHGGKDHGAFVRSLKEKQLTLKTSYLVKRHLQEKGYHVAMTRSKDIFLSLNRRVVLANRHPSSLFISIHYNSAKATAAQGIEIYYHESKETSRARASKKLASTVLAHMVRQAEAYSRGVKKGNFQVLRETEMPAILIEAGFITNSEERALLGTHLYLDQLAKGIAEGIDRYLQQ